MPFLNLFSTPENTAAVQNISQQVLAELTDDEEAETTSGFVAALLEMMRQGETITAAAADEPGGFGGGDLAVLVVVPVVAVTLNRLFTQLGVTTTAQLKQRLRVEPNPQTRLTVTPSDIEATVRQVGWSGSVKTLAKAVNVALPAYLLK